MIGWLFSMVVALVVGIFAGGALTLYALWKQGILTRDDFDDRIKWGGSE